MANYSIRERNKAFGMREIAFAHKIKELPQSFIQAEINGAYNMNEQSVFFAMHEIAQVKQIPRFIPKESTVFLTSDGLVFCVHDTA